MIIWNSKLLSHVEVWFDEPEPGQSFDVVMHRQAPAPIDHAENEPFHTQLIDLDWDEDRIHAGFDRNTRSKIRKAEPDGVRFEVIEQLSPTLVDEFIAYYDAFAEGKGLEKLYQPIFRAAAESGMMSFTRMVRADEVLVWHAQIAYGKRVTVTHSASHFRDAGDPEARNIVGRANRVCHWEEMRAWKRKGFHGYDMGGWYAGGTDPSLLLVNRFKEEFGGVKVVEYNSLCRRSLKARAVAIVKQHASV